MHCCKEHNLNIKKKSLIDPICKFCPKEPFRGMKERERERERERGGVRKRESERGEALLKTTKVRL